MDFELQSLLLSTPVLILAAIYSIIFLLVIYARWNYGVLEKLGIPVVKPHPLFGSTFATRDQPIGYRDIKWMKEYGPVFGVYKGRDPTIFVCDPEILRLIMVKDASTHFDANGPVDFGDKLLNEMPDYLPKDKWRTVRNFTSPAFSTAKLRIMNYPMKQALLEWGDNLKEKIKMEGGVLEKCAFDEVLYDALAGLTLRCLYSVQDNSGRFPKMLKELASPKGSKYQNLNAIAYSCPLLFNFLPPTLLSPEPGREFLKFMESLVASRTKPNSPPDVVDICIEQLKKLNTSEDYKKVKMTRETILFQAFNFFFSGQDQTSLVISALIYHILTSPPEQGIQEKLDREIETLWEKVEADGFPSRDRLVESHYLQACILEALRLYPLYTAERQCTKTWTSEEHKLTIPKGVLVVAPLWAVDRNPDYFDNPETFDPERFMPGNKEKLNPYAFSSFGHGPRRCTGKPLAMEILRVACSYIFKNFKFELRKDTELTFLPSSVWVFITHKKILFDVMLKEQ